MSTKQQNSNAEAVNPFDDDADDAAQPRQKNPMLRFCIIIAVVAVVGLFITTIAAQNAPPRSIMENVAGGLNTLSRVTLLSAFIGMLISFRLPQLKNLLLLVFGNMNTGSEEYSGTSNAKASFSGTGKSVKSSPIFILLLLVSLCIIGVCWILAFSLPTASFQMVGSIFNYGTILIACLAVTVAFHNRGPTQAFAIGVVVSLMLIRDSLTSSNLMSAFTGLGRFGSPGNMNAEIGRMLYTSHATTITVMLSAGLISAGYVSLLERARRKIAPSNSENLSQISNTEPNQNRYQIETEQHS